MILWDLKIHWNAGFCVFDWIVNNTVGSSQKANIRLYTGNVQSKCTLHTIFYRFFFQS